jgi:uncharacterized protein (DUF1501 family)
MFALGGPVRGGRVYGEWPGLAAGDLHEGRDLAVTTDYRQVFCEVLGKHLSVPSPEQLFPGFESTWKPLGIIRAA